MAPPKNSTLGNLNMLTGSKTYGYDVLDRLTSFTGGTSPLSYRATAPDRPSARPAIPTSSPIPATGSQAFSTAPIPLPTPTMRTAASHRMRSTATMVGRLTTAGKVGYDYNGKGTADYFQ